MRSFWFGSFFRLARWFCCVCLLFCGTAKAKSGIEKADSLFAAQRYSAAAEIYARVLREEKKTSRAALLRMAFIEEGRDNIVMSLYYLQHFYLLTPLPEVKRKIEEMAEANNLQGYAIDEADYAYYLYRRYAPWLEKSLFGISFILFSFLLYRKIKGVSLGYSPIFTLLFLASSAYFINFSLPFKRAITYNDKLLVMSEPSSGADVLGSIDRGQRVEWIGKEDVWYEIKWNEKKGWVKMSGLLFFP